MATDRLILPEGFVPTPVEDVLPEGFVPTPVVQEEEEKGTFQDIGQGIGAGVVNIGQGLVELGAAGVDAAMDTNYSKDVTDFFESTKEYLNFTPTGGAGKVAEGVVTFGSAVIPIVGWLGRANSIAKGAKVIPATSRFGRTAEAFGNSALGKTMLGNRVKLAGTTALATGAADVFIAPSTFNTLSDSFDALPDVLKTEADTGLTGSDEAYRRLRNKFRIGAEGFGLGLGFEAALPVVGTAARMPAYIPGVPQVARLFTNGFDKLAEKLSGGRLEKYFTAKGLAPREIYEGIQDVENVAKSSVREAEKRFQAFEKAAKKVVKSSKLFGRGKDGIDKAYNDLYTYLTGGFDVDELSKRYGSEVAKAAENMRSQVDGMTDIFMKSVEDVPDTVLNAQAKASLVKQFSDSQGKYLRRLYEVHLNPQEFVANPKLYEKAVKEVAGLIQKKSGLVGDELMAEATKVVNGTLRGNVVDAGLSVDNVLARLDSALVAAKKPVGPSNKIIKERSLFNISQGMLKDRLKWMEAAPTLRELMGEIKSPKELYLRTVNDMAETISANQFYRSIPVEDINTAAGKLAAGGRPLAINGRDVVGNTELEKRLADLNYKRMGEFATDEATKKMSLAEQAFGGQYGALTGHYVPVEIADSLTIAGRVNSPLQEALALSLQAKGLSQMAKTVLNPLSQIRNFNSGIFMVGANGNVARDMDLMESARLTIGKLADMEDAEFAKTFNILQKAGIVEQNYVVSEFRDLLKEGADLKVSGKVSDMSKKVLNKLPFVQSMQKVYSGTDNFWKTVGYMGEKAKYTNAIRRGTQGTAATMDDIAQEFRNANLAPRTSELTGEMDFLDLMATDIVKSTMPTYSRVPEVIKQIRKIPFVGNFMAFPAEIVRTTTNITRQGMRELGYKVSPELAAKLGPKKAAQLQRQIRAIGAKRLSNYAAMAYVTPIAVQKAAMELTDFTQEQMDALQRMAPWFMKGHTLVPIRNEKEDGKPQIEYIDLSYMMPYDFMVAPVRAAMQAYAEKGEITDSELDKIGTAMTEAVLKFTEPFASEGLLAERIADVTLRNGRTKTGSEIFIEGENGVDRGWKTVNHIMGGFTPGIIEMFYRERGGEMEPGRISKAAMGEPGRYGEEYTLAGEAASLLTGFREMKADLDKNFYYKGAEFTSKRSDLIGSFTSFAKRNDVTQDEILDKFIRVNQDLMKVQAEMFADIRAAQELGLSRSEIIRQLKEKSKLGTEELGLLLQGKFRPMMPTKNLLESIIMESRIEGQPRLANELPIRNMVAIANQMRGQPLQPPETDTDTESLILPEGFVPNPVVEPQSTPTAPVPIMPTAPAPQAQPQSNTRSLPFLGSNPIDALRNMEILQRISGGQ